MLKMYSCLCASSRVCVFVCVYVYRFLFKKKIKTKELNQHHQLTSPQDFYVFNFIKHKKKQKEFENMKHLK